MSFRIALILLTIAALPIIGRADSTLLIGAARIDVTPQTPVRLCGYAARKAESEGVEQPLYARALAIGSGPSDACVLVTIDSTAISAAITDAVSARIKEAIGIPRERLTFSVTHT